MSRNIIRKLLVYIALGALILLLTYLFFFIDGEAPPGAGLEKSDWLSFWGTYLGVFGSVALAVVAFWQNKQLNDLNKDLTNISLVNGKPFINITIENPYTEYRFLPKDIQAQIGTPPHGEFQPMLQIKNEKQFYIINCDNCELRRAMPMDDSFVQEVNDLPDCQEHIRFIRLENVTTNFAHHCKLSINEKENPLRFNIKANDYVEFLFVTKVIDDFTFTIDYYTLAGDIQTQTLFCPVKQRKHWDGNIVSPPAVKHIHHVL